MKKSLRAAEKGPASSAKPAWIAVSGSPMAGGCNVWRFQQLHLPLFPLLKLITRCTYIIRWQIIHNEHLPDSKPFEGKGNLLPSLFPAPSTSAWHRAGTQ